MKGVTAILLLSYSSLGFTHESGPRIRNLPEEWSFPQCTDSSRLTISIDEVEDAEHQRWGVVPGAPVTLHLTGWTNADISAEDDIALFVRSDVKNGIQAQDVTTFMKFSFCSQWTGIQCPVPAGTEFDAAIMWNAPLVKQPVSSVSLAILSERDTSSCFTIEYDVGDAPKYGIANGGEHLMAIRPSMVDNINAFEDMTWTAEVSPRFHRYSVSDAMRIAGGTVLRGHGSIPHLRPRTYVTMDIFPHWDAVQARRELRSTTGKHSAKAVSRSRTRSRQGTRRGVKRARTSATSPKAAERSVMKDFSQALSMYDWMKSVPSRHEPVYVEISEGDAIPDSFDAREAFPECASVIGRVRDQSDCGSCWAFASTEAFNDRRCIASIGDDGTPPQLNLLSAEDTTACCYGFSCFFSMGCNGGHPGSAWKWFTRTGVVTGGDYGDIGKGTTCKPYEFQPCSHHVDPSASGYPECPDGEYPTPSCLNTCSENSFGTSYSADKQKAKEAYSLMGVSDIQRDMMRYGSVTAAFTVFGDFLAYSGGVYQHVDGAYMGGHAVKIIGWGTDEATGMDYWLVVNSWNDSWGENGLFRIRRGVNECGIEGQIVAGQA